MASDVDVGMLLTEMQDVGKKPTDGVWIVLDTTGKAPEAEPAKGGKSTEVKLRFEYFKLGTSFGEEIVKRIKCSTLPSRELAGEQHEAVPVHVRGRTLLKAGEPNLVLGLKVHSGFGLCSEKDDINQFEGSIIKMAVEGLSYATAPCEVNHTTMTSLGCDRRAVQTIGSLSAKGMSAQDISEVVQTDVSIVNKVLNERDRSFPLEWNAAWYIPLRSPSTAVVTLQVFPPNHLEAIEYIRISVNDSISIRNRGMRELVRVNVTESHALLVDVEMELLTATETMPDLGAQSAWAAGREDVIAAQMSRNCRLAI
eukprot:gnl/TRDRNA2_/TRDRNA2_167350_c1_seq2.p1 gnl/TRDRNA2_/TRDRNA2_167350_c1~~gnl/TRDRNA2_/TRDRNA2_167350_c1_seq2.p1  ORF type:complete len:339 (-),score=56.30 gnl/TRDRNA2_/TRDRNA2_167350_c1_seq2:66-998(-)